MIEFECVEKKEIPVVKSSQSYFCYTCVILTQQKGPDVFSDKKKTAKSMDVVILTRVNESYLKYLLVFIA